MALPPCFNVLNEGWFNSVIGQIDTVTTPDQLQNLINQVYGDIGLLNSTIEGQLAFLGPIESLLTAPTDLASILTWIPNFITGFLTPYIAPLTKYATQVAALEAQVTAMTAEITAVAAANNWNITIPPVAPFCSI